MRGVMSKHSLVLLATAGFWSTSGGAQTAEKVQPLVTEDSSAAVTEDIVVTASKRTERLQDAPGAINVVTAKKLDSLNVRSFQDYASLVPSLNQAGGAGLGGGTIVLRGLTTGFLSTSNTSSVYVGETPFTPNGSYAIAAFTTPDPDLVDVERIEVLKGPQGTLYGASSLGGLIRIIPKEPDVNAEGVSGSLRIGGSAAQGGTAGYSARGSAYSALVPGLLAVGVSGFTRRDPGFITNVTTGRDDVGRADVKGGSASLVFRPINDLTFRGRVLYQKGKQIGQLYQSNLEATGQPLYGKRKQSSAFDENLKPEYRIYEATADYQSPIGALTATYSHAFQSFYEGQDYTPFYAPLFGAAFQAGSYLRGDQSIRTKADNVEVRLASRRLGRFEFLLGLYHTRQRSSFDVNFLGIGSSGSPLAPPFDNVLHQVTASSYRETAEFGNITFYLADNFDVTGGLRHTENRQGGSLVAAPGIFYPKGNFVPLEDSDSKVLYQVNARWRPNQSLSLYARTATGYRPGGAQSNPLVDRTTFGADEVTQYEIGVKGTLLERRLSFDAALYRTAWKSVQLNTIVGGFLSIGNGGEARIQGFEAEATYTPSGNLSVGGAFGYNDAKIRRVDPATSLAVGVNEGDRLPNSPRLTIAAYGDYKVPIGTNMTGAIGSTVRYQGNQVAAFSGEVLNPPYKSPAYTTLDLRASITREQVTVRAGVSNVTDRNAYTGYRTFGVVPGVPVPSAAYLTRPRTYYLSIGYEF